MKSDCALLHDILQHAHVYCNVVAPQRVLSKSMRVQQFCIFDFRNLKAKHSTIMKINEMKYRFHSSIHKNAYISIYILNVQINNAINTMAVLL